MNARTSKRGFIEATEHLQADLKTNEPFQIGFGTLASDHRLLCCKYLQALLHPRHMQIRNKVVLLRKGRDRREII